MRSSNFLFFFTFSFIWLKQNVYDSILFGMDAFRKYNVFKAATILYIFVCQFAYYVSPFFPVALVSSQIFHINKKINSIQIAYIQQNPARSSLLTLFRHNWISFVVSMAMNVSSVGNDTMAKIQSKSWIFCWCRRVSHRQPLLLNPVNFMQFGFVLHQSPWNTFFYRDCKSYHFQGPRFCIIYIINNE